MAEPTKEKPPEAPPVVSGSAAPPVDIKAAVAAEIASMGQAQLAALLATAQARGAKSDTPKMSATLDTLDAKRAERVIEALAGAEDAIASKAPDPMAALRKVAPEVETAIVANSTYRRKDHAHSISVAKRYLQARHPEGRR